MNPAKLDIAFAFTNYAGNGGIASTIPYLRRWWAPTFAALAKDERVGRIADLAEPDVSDTPITMVRNRCLKVAQENKFDILVFIDSDNLPDLWVGDARYPDEQSFIPSAFDFCYKRLINGIPTVIAAPYCGPPVHPTGGGEENVYAFKWANLSSDDCEFTGARVIQYDRDEAAKMRGIHPAAAMPTGLCMITMAVIDCLPPPYFRYEWEDKWEARKASTEDVFFTRNIAMAGAKRWGTPVVFAHWNSWAGHYKQKCVGRPTRLQVEQVSEVFAEAVRTNYTSKEGVHFLGFKRDGTISIPASLREAIDAEELKEQAEAWTEDRKTLALRGIDPHGMTIEVCGKPFQTVGFVTPEPDRQVIAESLYKRFSNEKINGVEVGSWTGATACEMLAALPGLTLTCVDTFEGTPNDLSGPIKREASRLTGDANVIRTMFHNNIQTLGFGSRVFVIQDESVRAAEVFDDATLDFVVLDADHSYEGVQADLRAWLPKLKPGGMILGHDWNDLFPGVRQAVQEEFGDAVIVARDVWRVELGEAPQADHYAIKPGMVEEKYTEFNETLVTEDERLALSKLLAQTFTRRSKNRKFVYVGRPCPGTLDILASKGPVFCICEQDSPATAHAVEFFKDYTSVKFVYCQSLEEAIYESYWEDGDADLAFVHSDAASADIIQRSFELLKPDGILCGNGDINEEAFEGTPVGVFEDLIWGITRDEYFEALESNGKANVPTAG